MNGFVKQFLKFWTELGNNQKVSLILATVGVIAAMAAIVVWSGKPQMVLLYGGIDSKDMADVVKALDEQAVPYEIKPGNSVYVSKENVYKVRMDLASKGVPTGGTVGYEIFDRTSFGVSDFVQRTNFTRALQGELQRTITQLRGVRSARVMIVTPQNRLMVADKPAHSTASVMVDTGGKKLETDAVNSIRFLVANSVEGLDPNDVVVVDANGNALSQDLVQDTVIGAASGQFKFRKHMEDYFTQKVETMLARVVGQQNVVARVSVELDTEAVSSVEDKFDPNGQVVRNQTSNDETNRTIEVKPAAATPAPGANPQDPNAQVATAVATTETPRNTTEGVRKNKTVNYEINHSRTETVKAPGNVRRISAAVFIAERFNEQDGKRVAEPRSAEEIERLRQMIVQAIGVEEGTAPNERYVTLEETDFAPAVNPADEMKPDVMQQVFSWVDVMKNFIAVGFAAIMILIFLRVLKKHKPEPYTLEIMDEETSDNKKGADVVPRLTPELLNELIREKPENVSTALRNWAVDANNKK